MIGSMYSAVSGLSAHQTKMNVIGNNIANVNTYGFKASRVTFSDVFYQTMSGASSPSNAGGGTNPTQLGYGSKVSSIDVLNTRSGSATTDRALDVYIDGDGYLPVKNSDGVIKYTRIGVLSFDLAGNLVDRNGNQVLGFRLDETTKNAQLNSDGTTSIQNLVAIRVSPAEADKYTGIAIGQNGEITAIKEGDPAFTPSADTAWMDGTPKVTGTSLYKGAVHMTVTRESSGTPALTISSNANVGTGAFTLGLNGPETEYVLTAPDGKTYSVPMSKVDTSTTPNTLTFNVQDYGTPPGETATITIPVGAGGHALPVGDGDPLTDNAVPCGGVTANYTITATTTDKSGATVPLSTTWDGTAGSLALGDMTVALRPADFEKALQEKGFSNVNVGSVGPGPGQPIKIAHIAIAKFANADGLSQDGQGYYVETTNSGEAVATIAGNGGTGNMRSGSLEMSNVDLSREFTEMIITQRGFQANTRMITVSDEMLSELVSMKR